MFFEGNGDIVIREVSEDGDGVFTSHGEGGPSVDVHAWDGEGVAQGSPGGGIFFFAFILYASEAVFEAAEEDGTFDLAVLFPIGFGGLEGGVEGLAKFEHFFFVGFLVEFCLLGGDFARHYAVDGLEGVFVFDGAFTRVDFEDVKLCADGEGGTDAHIECGVVAGDYFMIRCGGDAITEALVAGELLTVWLGGGEAACEGSVAGVGVEPIVARADGIFGDFLGHASRFLGAVEGRPGGEEDFGSVVEDGGFYFAEVFFSDFEGACFGGGFQLQASFSECLTEYLFEVIGDAFIELVEVEEVGFEFGNELHEFLCEGLYFLFLGADVGLGDIGVPRHTFEAHLDDIEDLGFDDAQGFVGLF